MGLQEKKAAKAAQDTWLPKREQELTQISGANVSYEVDWDSFSSDLKGIQWLEHNGPQQVAMAFRRLCDDEVGKEGIQEGLKKVVLRNVTDIDDKSLSMEGDVLELKCAFAQSPKGRFNDIEIMNCLSEGL